MSDDPIDHEARFRVSRSGSTLRAQAVNKLRAAIAEASFRPGERLVERKLCDMLGVSRPLVREALRQLEAEGLVQNTPYKGPVVATFTPAEVGQIYEIRGALEGLAAKLFAERASDEQVKALADAIEQISQGYSRGDLHAAHVAIEQFYETLLRGSGNEMLWSYLASLRARVGQLRAMSLAQPERRLTSLEEKRKILAAIEARDPQAARLASESHIQHAGAAALEMITFSLSRSLSHTLEESTDAVLSR